MQQRLSLGATDKGATFNDARTHRQTLWRVWGPSSGPRAVFIGLNPSTATEQEDDHTIRRCRTMAKAWGCAGFWMLNLYDFRDRHPSGLWAAEQPNTIANDYTIASICTDPRARVVVAAWGSFPKAATRVEEVCRLLRVTGAKLHALGTSKTGHPLHPGGRRLPRVVRPQRWSPGQRLDVVEWTEGDTLPPTQALPPRYRASPGVVGKVLSEVVINVSDHLPPGGYVRLAPGRYVVARDLWDGAKAALQTADPANAVQQLLEDKRQMQGHPTPDVWVIDDPEPPPSEEAT